jgi:hypothetical protein
LHQAAIFEQPYAGEEHRGSTGFAVSQGMVVNMTDLRKVLVLGGVEPPAPSPNVVLTRLTYAELNARVLSTVLPDLVILPLFGQGFDAIDALGQLERFGYRGDVLVRAPALPNVPIVERELAALAPNLRVRLTGPSL